MQWWSDTNKLTFQYRPFFFILFVLIHLWSATSVVCRTNYISKSLCWQFDNNVRTHQSIRTSMQKQLTQNPNTCAFIRVQWSAFTTDNGIWKFMWFNSSTLPLWIPIFGRKSRARGKYKKLSFLKKVWCLLSAYTKKVIVKKLNPEVKLGEKGIVVIHGPIIKS